MLPVGCLTSHCSRDSVLQTRNNNKKLAELNPCSERGTAHTHSLSAPDCCLSAVAEGFIYCPKTANTPIHQYKSSIQKHPTVTISMDELSAKYQKELLLSTLSICGANAWKWSNLPTTHPSTTTKTVVICIKIH